MLVSYAPAPAPGALRLMMMGGDWIPLSIPDRLWRAWPGVQPVSTGGATECSIISIVHAIGAVDPRWRSIPYGTPLQNQRVHVLDARLEPTLDRVPGDLFIAGVGLGRGYWRDEARTAA